MTHNKQNAPVSLGREALEQIERLIFKGGDDVAVSIARSFERLEERMDGMEARLRSRLSELEDQMAETNLKAASAVH